MGVLELVNNLSMTVLIGMFILVAIQLIIRTRGEETRKTSEHAGKELEKVFDKTIEAIKTTVKDIKKEMEEDEYKKWKLNEMKAAARKTMNFSDFDK